MGLITTVSNSQTEILSNILHLYNHDAPFDADVTYGNGSFYKNIPRPQYNFDLVPKFPSVIAADVRALPIKDDSFSSIIFDPPFIHAPGKDSIMGNRFGGYPRQKDLRAMYTGAIDEIGRVLRLNGLFVFKCQDCIESGIQNFNHISIYDMALKAGFKAMDLFVLVRNTAIIGYNHHIQKHARKTHSYFWVFN